MSTAVEAQPGTILNIDELMMMTMMIVMYFVLRCGLRSVFALLRCRFGKVYTTPLGNSVRPFYV